LIKFSDTQHSQKGNSIAEFGPALGILLLAFFFPLLDLVMFGFAYSQCLTLNSLQAQRAAELARAQARDPGGTVIQGLPNAWQRTGMGSFVGLTAPPLTAITYATAVGSDQYVIVTTTFSVRPFLTIPLIPGVPGLSAPATFTVSTQRVVEDPTS
jgi:hypothetical protein